VREAIENRPYSRYLDTEEGVIEAEEGDAFRSGKRQSERESDAKLQRVVRIYAEINEFWHHSEEDDQRWK
jgi:hypothetical protein